MVLYHTILEPGYESIQTLLVHKSTFKTLQSTFQTVHLNQEKSMLNEMRCVYF